MIESLMLCGIGLLAGCLLTLLIIPLVHERAVRLTMRRLAEALPLTASEIRADKDLLRAQFAMALRQLEVNIEELRQKSAGQMSRIGRNAVEINQLRLELDKRATHILALQARDQVRRSITRKVVKILLYIFTRSKREARLRLGAVRRGAANIARAA